jgi:hypothetical protein
MENVTVLFDEKNVCLLPDFYFESIETLCEMRDYLCGILNVPMSLVCFDIVSHSIQHKYKKIVYVTLDSVSGAGLLPVLQGLSNSLCCERGVMNLIYD